MAIPVTRAIIIGGGIGGLCTAIGLRQVGIEAVVYERAPAFSDVGAGLVLWPNAMRVLRRFGVAEPVITAGARIKVGAIQNWRGQTLSRSHSGELEKNFGEPTIAIHRARLHQSLVAALPGDCVKTGESCIGFEQNDDEVIARFQSGQQDRGELLIGADGIHSLIRQQLFPEIRLRYAGYTAWRGVVTTNDEVALGMTTESWGCGQRFGIVPVSSHEIYWFATANAPEGMKQTPTERRGFLLEKFRGWHHPVELLLENTSAEAVLHNDIYDFPPAQQWSRGRVTLLGDAAHPTTPNLGQGACQAIESSLALSRALRRSAGLSAALRCYETERRPRTAWITQQSWKFGRIAQFENRLLCALRNFVVRLTPESLMSRQVIEIIGKQA